MSKLLAAGIAAIGASAITPTLHACFVPTTTPKGKFPVVELPETQHSTPSQLKNLVVEIPQAIQSSLTPPDIEAQFSMSDSIILILAIALMLVLGGFSYTFLAVKKED